MTLDKKARSYLIGKFHHGKNCFARILDRVLGCAALTVFLFSVFWSLHLRLISSLILALTASLTLEILWLMVAKYRRERFIAAQLEEIRRECALEKILLLSKGEFRSLSREIFAEETGRSQFQSVLGGLFLPEEKIFCYAFPNHPQNPVGIQQILLLYRKIKRLHAQSALLLSAAPFEEDASAMPERLGIPVHILGQEALLEAVPPQSISDEQVMDALHARMSAQLTREKVKRSFLAENKQRAYLLCALLLIAWSFFIGFNLLYPILAALCVFLSFYSYISGKKEKNSAA